ncbi:hypothetical protein Sulac_3311 [Sulfobacillus acidophilus DSM 10332]|uniref:Uncharacterized protein n=1 Tax=Sulfobacillus acidophilus (strain ATCC 700253 / DSM 10332 / NAL) TaxID=679936 RepID=G8TT57_SULAD|nr:hypothetical protein Sulac_3311 [Sulfobacillus acidophilus DSM 10332]
MSCQCNNAAWKILVDRLKKAQSVHDACITYMDLAKNLNQSLSQCGNYHFVGQQALDCIQAYCCVNKIPDLTALVIHKNGDHLPGNDFWRRHGLDPTVANPNQKQSFHQAPLESLWHHRNSSCEK